MNKREKDRDENTEETGTANGLMQPVCVIDEQSTSSELKQGHYMHENMHSKVCVDLLACISVKW